MQDQVAPQPKYLRDYTPAPFTIPEVHLEFRLDPHETIVTARYTLERNELAAEAGNTVSFDGRALKLMHLLIDGRPCPRHQYVVDDRKLTVASLPDRCEIEIQTAIDPENNSTCMGLYKSGSTYCTQMEAEGFRRVTYFLDRPDVLSVYRTTIIGPRDQCPIMLSNGNLVEQRELEGNLWQVVWEDPFPKPCYLFALVAGDLACVRDSFVTMSGREVKLEIYVDHGNEDRCAHAMHSLKKAMKWDEDVFGLEYDLDVFMIVAVSAFNFGAMENKGLNIFNSNYVLADPKTATDADYMAIEAVIAHEYFHNWTGNRVTCRDWFQLTLKEGLTVFRDQEFSGDMNSRAVQRIEDVRTLRERQFPEDSGPNAHPIRPESYIDIDNFYTPTVYEKGAEIIRMVHTLIGKEAFRRGIDKYFELYDGKAVTTDDFIFAMELVSGRDFGQFKRWYSQAGTPRLRVVVSREGGESRLKISIAQSCPATPGQEEKEPFELPFTLGLINRQGLPVEFSLEEGVPVKEAVLVLNAAEQEVVLSGVNEEVVPSLLRNFTAPVHCDYEYSDADLALLMSHDVDHFNRYDAASRLGMRYLVRFVDDLRNGRDMKLPVEIVSAYETLLLDTQADDSLKAEALILPTEASVIEALDVAYIDEVHKAREYFKRALAEGLRDYWFSAYEALSKLLGPDYVITNEALAARKLKNAILSYLAQLDDDQEAKGHIVEQFYNASNMTDQFSAFGLLCHLPEIERAEYVEYFYRSWSQYHQVIDKWLAAQAYSKSDCTLSVVQGLEEHEAFDIKNPNRVRSLYGAFGRNLMNFHRPDGAGYHFLVDRLLRIDQLNPKLAAGLATLFSKYAKLPRERKELLRVELERVLDVASLSRGVYEIISKTLRSDRPDT